MSLIVTVAKLLITPRVPGSKPEPTFSGSAFTSRQRRNLRALALQNSDGNKSVRRPCLKGQPQK